MITHPEAELYQWHYDKEIAELLHDVVDMAIKVAFALALVSSVCDVIDSYLLYSPGSISKAPLSLPPS